MSDLISRTARLVPYTKRPKHGVSFATAYVHEPAANETGAELGNFYVVVEVLVSGRASEEVVDLIIQTAGDAYYNNATAQSEPLVRFEAAVKQTNHELSEYVGRGNAAWIGKLSAIIAVQAGRELHVAQTGSAEAFLYRGKAVSRISVSHTDKPATPSKTFGSIATGELEIGDKLLIATPALVHQIPLTKLQQVISSTSPNTAIGELSQLLEAAETTRIAALITEITTPELAALKVRSEEPAEIELGNNENLAETAYNIAAPIAHSTVNHSRKAAQAAASGWDKLKPVLKSANLNLIAAFRRVLTTHSGRRTGLIISLATIVIFIFVVWHAAVTNSSAKTFSSYQNLFQQYTTATDISKTDKATAHQKLANVQDKLRNLSGQQSAINSQLKNNLLLEGEPTSYTEFMTLVTSQIDLIDGLIKVTPFTVAEIGGKSGKPNHFETDGTRAYVIDSSNHNTISIVNLQTGTQSDSPAVTTALSDVVSTTISSAGDGFYILTNKPSVWFYKFATNTLIEQTLAYGSWPKATALASYASNLYLLGSNTVYKQTRNASGYSPATDYISTTAGAQNPTGLAVDGWVYIQSNSSLQRYLGPTLKQTAASPNTLGAITSIRSVADGDVIIGTSTSTGRIALWHSATDLKFSQQVALSEGKTLYDATYDQKLGKIFATVDNRLVSFDYKP